MPRYIFDLFVWGKALCLPCALALAAGACGGEGPSAGSSVLSEPTDLVAQSASVPTIEPVAAKYIVVGAPSLTTLTGFAWPGKSVVVMTPTSNLDAHVMTAIVTGLDKIWGYYEHVTGRLPDPDADDTYNGLDVVGVVPDTTPICGAACSNIGANGTSILQTYFDALYDDVSANGSFDQVMPYEFGRNFWFYGSQLAYPDDDPVTTGFAIYMRFQSMNEEKIAGGPFNGIAFPQFEADLKALVTTYEGNSHDTWATTLEAGQGVPNAAGLGASDLLASFLFRVGKDFAKDGMDAFTVAFWRQAGRQPAAATTQDAVDNFVLSACHAVKKNLTSEFAKEFRWPVSKSAGAEAQKLFGNPVKQEP